MEAMFPPVQPKIASSCATVAPLFAARVAPILRTPCADFRTPAARHALANKLPNELFGKWGSSLTADECQVPSGAGLECL